MLKFQDPRRPVFWRIFCHQTSEAGSFADEPMVLQVLLVEPSRYPDRKYIIAVPGIRRMRRGFQRGLPFGHDTEKKTEGFVYVSIVPVSIVFDFDAVVKL